MTTQSKSSDSARAQSILSTGMGSFVALWLGQIVSLVGSGMTCFAENVWVYTDLGRSITHLTLLALSASVPGYLISSLAGAVVDRWDRRWIMIISDTVAALATLTLRILIVTETFTLWHIYAITMVLSIANHFQWPAFLAIISSMVPKQRLGYANGLVQLGRGVGQVAAPLLAGTAVMLFRIEGVILFDLATYVFSLVMLLLVRFPETIEVVKEGTPQRSLIQEAIDGWKYLFSRRGLFALLMFFAVSNTLFMAVSSLVKPLILGFTSPASLGVIQAVGSTGVIGGALLMSVWGGPKRRINGILGFMLIQSVAIMLGGIRPSSLLVGVAYVLAAFSTPIVNGCSTVIWQTKVPHRMQGRVLAASSMLAGLAPSIGVVVAGPLADRVFEPLLAADGGLAGSLGLIIGTGDGRGVGFMLILLGALCILVTACGYLYPRIRLLDEELPDVH